MFLSISVPIYNAEKYLDNCLESILKQTFDDYELILVNDGSSDNSLNICNKWKNKYPDIIKVFNKKNSGSLLTRKKCIEESLGEYIYIIDADDYLVDNNALSNIYNILNRNKVDICFFDSIDDDGNISNYPIKSNEIIWENEKSNIYRSILTSSALYPLWNKIFARKLVDFNTDYYDYEEIVYGTDFYQTIPLISKANSLFYYKSVIYHYRNTNNPNSIVHKFNPKSFVTAKKNQKRLEWYAHNYNWNIEGLEDYLTASKLDRIATAAYKCRLIKEDEGISKYHYLKEIGDDIYFRNGFSLRYIPLNKKIFLILLYLRLYKFLSFVL